jgi:hypothetical protein
MDYEMLVQKSSRNCVKSNLSSTKDTKTDGLNRRLRPELSRTVREATELKDLQRTAWNRGGYPSLPLLAPVQRFVFVRFVPPCVKSNWATAR